MEFHTWQTLFDEFKALYRNDPVKRKMTNEQIFAAEQASLIEYPFKNPNTRIDRLMRLAVERRWIDSGRPYYNVHPQLVRSLCKTNLDKIPSGYVEMPEGLDVVCFRFAEEVPIQYLSNVGAHALMDDRVHNSPIFCRSLLFSRVGYSGDEELQRIAEAANLTTEQVKLVQCQQFILFLDEGFRAQGTDNLTLCNLVNFGAEKDQTIPQAIQACLANMSNRYEKLMWMALGERLSNLLKIIVSCGFLANSNDDGLVVPDILSKDRTNYADAVKRNDTEKIKQIVERARRRGKLGYNIGTNEMFVGEAAIDRQERASGTGNELKYSHLRGGHPHAVRYGEGSKKVKIKWFRPTRVRKDLPFKVD